MAGESKEHPLSVLKRLFTPFAGSGNQAGKTGDSGLQGAYESVTKIAAIMAERGRLRGLEANETGKLDGLSTQLDALDRERIQALTEFRISGDAGANERAQALLKRCAEIGQEIDDARAVAGGINSRIQALEEQLKSLSRLYRRDLGVFLTTIHSRLIDRYNEAAPGVAEIVLQLAATRRVMMRYLAGNSNGWDGRILLPGMRPEDGNPITPLLDGDSAYFNSEANERMSGIADEMSAAGFIWRVDLP